MKWTPAQKEFLESDESTLFVGGRQVGKTTILKDKAKRLLNSGRDVVIVTPNERMSKPFRDDIGTLQSVSYICTEEGLRGWRGNAFIIDEYEACPEEVHNLTGDVYATTTKYWNDIGQFSNCVTSFGPCHFHNSGYGNRMNLEHYGAQFNGHTVLFQNEGPIIAGECSICGMMKSARCSYYIGVLSMFTEECPYRKI